MLKSEKGLTFLVCVITIVVLIIIGTAVASAGISTYKNSKVKVFVSEMKMIQEKINLYADKAEVNSLKDISAIGCSVTDEEQATYQSTRQWLEMYSGISDDNANYISTNEGFNFKNDKKTNEEYLRYIDATTESSELEIKDISRPVIYDYKNKKLFSIEPIEYKGKKCYTLDEINN